MKAESKIMAYLSTAFIVGLLLGLGSNYFLSSTTIKRQEAEIIELYDEIAVLEQQRDKLLLSVSEYDKTLQNLQAQLAEQRVSEEFFGAFNNSQRVPFTIDVGEKGADNVTISFDVGYGIIMEVYVNLVKDEYGSDIDVELSWKRGSASGFLVGLGNANAESASIVNGIAYCEVFDNPDENRVVVKVGAFIKEYPWIEKSRLESFSK